MKDPMRSIDRFCYKHPNFGIPNLMKYIAIGSVFFWLAGTLNPGLLNYLSYDPALILQGQVWRLISFMFIPPTASITALIVIYFYYWLGSTLEQHWGTPQFNIFFFSGVLLTVLYGFLIYFLFGIRFIMTAQYIYLSMFFSFAVLFPDMQVLLFFLFPVKMKFLALFDALFFVLSVFSTPFPANLLPIVAILNFLIFCGGELLPRRQKPSAATVNFRKESRRIRREQEAQLYRHKCAVCGKTDRDYPELEFRYCSRCQGYHCFCEEHINNHIHFTE